jgi:hypothetical protein
MIRAVIKRAVVAPNIAQAICMYFCAAIHKLSPHKPKMSRTMASSRLIFDREMYRHSPSGLVKFLHDKTLLRSQEVKQRLLVHALIHDDASLLRENYSNFQMQQIIASMPFDAEILDNFLPEELKGYQGSTHWPQPQLWKDTGVLDTAQAVHLYKMVRYDRIGSGNAPVWFSLFKSTTLTWPTEEQLKERFALCEQNLRQGRMQFEIATTLALLNARQL